MLTVTPSVAIELHVEAKAPRVLICASNEGEERRLHDWLATQPALIDLIERALQLAEEARAA